MPRTGRYMKPRNPPAPPARRDPTPVRMRPLFGGVALAALVFLVYWPTLNNGFVSDDMFYVRDTQDLQSLAGLRDIWFKIGATPQYYPLVHTVLWGEYHLWGLEPRGYHLASTTFHLAVVLLLWRLLKRLHVPGAWLGAAVFAVHPVQVETVAWASEQKNLLSAAFALGAILAYLRFQPETEAQPGSNRWAAYVLALVLFTAALMCKTVTITTPAVILVIYWWKRGRVSWRDALPLVPFFAVGMALSYLTVWMEVTLVGAIGAEWNHTLLERLLIASRAVWFYAGKLLWPYPLTFVYPRWHIDATAWWQYLFPAAALGLLVVLWLLRHRLGRGPLAAALIFGGVLTPALGFFDVYPFLFSFVADHYQYHASMAALAAIAAGGMLLAKRQDRRWVWPAALCAAAVLTALTVLAHQNTYAYKDNETLIRDGLRLYPQAWAAQYRYGVLLSNAHNYDNALVHFREAQRLFPEHTVLHTSIGNALAAQGRFDEAVEEYNRSLAGELHPDDRATTHFQLATALAQQGKAKSAIDHYRKAIALEPSHSEGLYNLGVLLSEQGEAEAAIDAFRQALAVNPRALPAQRALAATLAKRGDLPAAIAALQTAVQSFPADTRLREQLAGLLFQGGDLQMAEQQLREAIRIEPSADAHNLLGAVFGSRDDLDAAIEQFQAALRIDPQHRGATDNLQKARAARK